MKMLFGNKTTRGGLRKHYIKEDYNKYRFTLENKSPVKTICFVTFVFNLEEALGVEVDQPTGDTALVRVNITYSHEHIIILIVSTLRITIPDAIYD